jgi:hypothetical protein
VNASSCALYPSPENSQEAQQGPTWHKSSNILHHDRHTPPQDAIPSKLLKTIASPLLLLLLLLLPAAVLHKLLQRPNVAKPCLCHPADVKPWCKAIGRLHLLGPKT